MESDEEILELMNIAKEMELKAFKGKGKGNKHLERVLKISQYLVKKLKEKGIEVNERVVYVSAALHDIGLGNKNHPKVGAEIAEKILKERNYDEKFIEKVKHCIEAHEGDIEAKTVEAKIVHDADALDKMGALGIIRHTWKLANYGFPTEEIAKVLVPHIKEREKRLYLEESRELAKKINKILDEFDRTLKMQLNLDYL